MLAAGVVFAVPAPVDASLLPDPGTARSPAS